MENTSYAEKLNNDTISLEDKLKLIDTMVNDKEYLQNVNKRLGRPLDAPVDPQDVLNCEGCQ